MSAKNARCECGSGLKRRNCHGAAVLVPGTAGGPGSNRYGEAEHEVAEYLHVLMPTRGTVTVETMNFVASIGWSPDVYSSLGVKRATLLYMPRLGVAEARERLAEAVLRGMDAQPKATHWLLWLDDDAVPIMTDILALLNEARRSPDLGIVSCYYSPKVAGHPGFVPRFASGPGGHENVMMVPGVDFQPHHLVEVPWVGLHCAIMNGAVLRRLKRPFFPFDAASGAGEDVLFSHRIREAGYKCAVVAGVIVAHVDAETGERFVPNIGATRLPVS